MGNNAHTFYTNTMTLKKKSLILPIIVISQVSCVSLWFAGNAVMENMVMDFQLPAGSVANITSAVQFGFILGTFLFALFMIADRYPPSKVFFFSALAGALVNGFIVFVHQSFTSLLLLRFLTGFSLAGIYPIGMKIASDHFDNRLGKALGFLVGALVLGTALPHLLKGLSGDLKWQYVILSTSVLALFGGTLMLVLVPNGPNRKSNNRIDLYAFPKIFRSKELRAASFGYFGHMWELYAFWAFVPFMLMHYQKNHPQGFINVPLLSFFIIGVGAIACVLSGYLSQRYGTKKIAATALLSSCICGIVSPLIFIFGNGTMVIVFLLFWSMAVIADSPLFSTLVAQSVQAEYKGTALTVVTCIGFSITIISIQLVGYLTNQFNPDYIFTILSIGPLAGLFGLLKPVKGSRPTQWKL